MKGNIMLKKLLVLMVLFTPIVALAADKAKDEPVEHLTDEQIYEQLKKLALVFETARDNFVEEADEKKMLEAAMNGMLQALDPHSSYLSADDFKEFNDKSLGEFGGLGIQITSDRGAVRVISPIDDTPADKAGIKAGDYITHIDDEPVFDLTLNQATKKMKGRPGTKVKLTVISGLLSYTIASVESSSPLRISIDTGAVFPLHAGAAGKILMCCLDDNLIYRYYQLHGIRYTDKTIMEFDEIKRELELVRKRGYATDSGEYLPEIRAVAVPVLNSAGQIIASISVTYPSFVEERIDIEQLASQITQTANSVSEAFRTFRHKSRVPAKVVQE